jgi:8-oxo-dGTP pyrophosphatase MutT (NUDIX family)
MTSERSYQLFIEAVREELLRELPGLSAQCEMAPPQRKNEDDVQFSSKTCTDAAVLVLFYPDNEAMQAPRILLTVRPEGMSKHAGQVAFPGGRWEEGESLVETALRETEEEVLIPKTQIDVLGALTPLYIPPTRFCVYPFVGAMYSFPDMEAQSDEVASMFGVSTQELNNPSFRHTFMNEISGIPGDTPYFSLNDEKVWGATAMMLAELSVVIQSIDRRRKG